MSNVSVAIDGPSGAGKSTIAKTLAQELGFLYVDTGAIYRTVGLYVKRKEVCSDDAVAVTALLPEIKINIEYLNGIQHMFLNSEDVTKAIREHDISSYASKVSAIPQVRTFLLNTQREYARNFNVIMDGRDIGTVVIPNAQIKIFLTATPEDRAYRRYIELLARGQDISFDVVLRDIKERDLNDSSRATAPLKSAQDAILVDTTGNTLEESIIALRTIITERISHDAL